MRARAGTLTCRKRERSRAFGSEFHLRDLRPRDAGRVALLIGASLVRGRALARISRAACEVRAVCRWPMPCEGVVRATLDRIAQRSRLSLAWGPGLSGGGLMRRCSTSHHRGTPGIVGRASEAELTLKHWQRAGAPGCGWALENELMEALFWVARAKCVPSALYAGLPWPSEHMHHRTVDIYARGDPL